MSLSPSMTFFDSKQTTRLLARLASAGVIPTPILEPATNQTATLSGKTFVITGALPGVSRDHAKAMILSAGGKVVGSVSTKTNYLLAGSDAGSKLAKANDIGVPVIDFLTLQTMLGNTPQPQPSVSRPRP